MSNDALLQENIKSLFYSIDSIEDFCNLLNRIYQHIFPSRDTKSNVVISVKDLNYYAFDRSRHKYKTFAIRKKDGGSRIIKAPNYKLKTILKCLNWLFNTLFIPHNNAYGFVKNRNVANNAAPHVGKLFVYNIDLLNFFPSTSFRRIKSVFELPPFYLNGDKPKLPNREKLGFLIANLCCDAGFLPQGAPTSPILTNVVCRRMDKKLHKFSKQNNCTYTRYADDITFSSYKQVFDESFKNGVKSIIENEENYKINDKKERLQSYGERQTVTGLVVNQKLNVTRDYNKDIRFWLWSWDKWGYEQTQSRFAEEFVNKKSYQKYNGKAPSFVNYLSGKIRYLSMIRGRDDERVKRYVDNFNKMISDTAKTFTTVDLLQILRKIDTHGKDSIDYSFKKNIA
ncbi:reverse transcriptase family protein [Sphingobacterium multivorum]|uniref:reverse transcriptase family protein n=1 Tax=Sphingobacterium multivorum TaxID=28454 RepID=UPI00301AFC31